MENFGRAEEVDFTGFYENRKCFFTKSYFVFKNIFSIFVALKRVKMKGSFLHSAAPPPAEKISCEGTEFFCILKTDLTCVLRLKPITTSLSHHCIQHFIRHTIKSVIQKLQLFLFSLHWLICCQCHFLTLLFFNRFP